MGAVQTQMEMGRRTIIMESAAGTRTPDHQLVRQFRERVRLQEGSLAMLGCAACVVRGQRTGATQMERYVIRTSRVLREDNNDSKTRAPHRLYSYRNDDRDRDHWYFKHDHCGKFYNGKT